MHFPDAVLRTPLPMTLLFLYALVVTRNGVMTSDFLPYCLTSGLRVFYSRLTIINRLFILVIALRIPRLTMLFHRLPAACSTATDSSTRWLVLQA